MGCVNLLKITFTIFLLIVFSAIFPKVSLLKLIQLSNSVAAEIITEKHNNHKQQIMLSPNNMFIKLLMEECFRTLNKEDLTGYMNNFAEDSPQYETIKNTAATSFKLYDLKYELKNYRIVSISDEETKVKSIQITTKLRGETFRNNIITALHTLRRYDYKWKIYDSKILSIDYLD